MRSSTFTRLLSLLALAALLPAVTGCDSPGVTGVTQVKVLPPKIESFSPKVGAPGTRVTIVGSNFLVGREQPTVQFAGIAAAVVSADSSTIIATGFTAGCIARVARRLFANAGDAGAVPPVRPVAALVAEAEVVAGLALPTLKAKSSACFER